MGRARFLLSRSHIIRMGVLQQKVTDMTITIVGLVYIDQVQFGNNCTSNGKCSLMNKCVVSVYFCHLKFLGLTEFWILCPIILDYKSFFYSIQYYRYLWFGGHEAFNYTISKLSLVSQKLRIAKITQNVRHYQPTKFDKFDCVADLKPERMSHAHIKSWCYYQVAVQHAELGDVMWNLISFVSRESWLQIKLNSVCSGMLSKPM